MEDIYKSKKVPFGVEKKNNPPSLEDAASLFEFIFILYMDPIFVKGYKQGIEHYDLGTVSAQDETHGLYVRFWDFLSTEMQSKSKEKRSLWHVLWQTVTYGRIGFALFLYFIYSCFAFGPVLILNAMVRHFEGTAVLPSWALWTMVFGIFVLSFFGSVIAAHSNGMMAHIGLQIRNCLIDSIYRKAMRLSPGARQSSSTGQIVNMFATDTRQLQAFLFFVNNVAMAPFQIFLALYLVYREVGVAAFVGFSLMFAVMPANLKMFQALAGFRKKLVFLKDVRVKMMNEILSGIRIIKYYSWELAFEDKLNVFRVKELVVLKHIAYVVALGFTLVFSMVPVLQPILVFFTYVALGNELTAAKAFTTIALFNVMQLPFIFLPMGVAQFTQSLVSCERMINFFSLEELGHYVQDGSDGYTPALCDTSDAGVGDEDGKGVECVIEMNNADLYWVSFSEHELESQRALRVRAGSEKALRGSDEDDEGKKDYVILEHTIPDLKEGQPIDWLPEPPLNRSSHTLMDMNVRIPQGQLVAVVGPVGSGKSSFLSALLGEMTLRSGSVYMRGSVAFCNQQPWVLNDTLKGNVLFGDEYNEVTFDEAVYASSLEDDIRILPGGVMTEIGEKGINLSGGQKARVQLARAVYKDADIYLLDDPLSAVDAHVGEHLFRECIRKRLAGKTRVLVTHQVHLLSQCDHIIVLVDGKIKAQGSFAELQRSGVDISSYVAAADDSEEGKEVGADEEVEDSSTTSPSPRSRANTYDKTSSGKSSSSGKSAAAAAIEAEKKAKADERHLDTRTSRLTTLEERKLGDVTTDTYLYYLRAGGWYWFMSGVLFQLASQGFQVYTSFWLSRWSAESVEKRDKGEEMSSSRNLYYINLFAVFSMCVMGCLMIKSILIAHHRIGTSTILHDDLLRSVMQAPVWFFDVTPLGRILNRFSSDMTVVDEELSQSINQALNSFFGCLGAAAGVAAATKGAFVVLMVPLTYAYGKVQSYFRKTNTTIARLEGISRSPIYADLSEVLGGMDSVRAYGQEMRFINRLEERVDHNTVAAMMQQLGSQWLAVRLDFLGSFISFFIALFAVSTAKYNFIPAGYLGMGLMYSFTITNFLKFCVRILATGEAQMNSVERVMFYIEYVEPEEVFAKDKGGKLRILNAEQAEEIEKQAALGQPASAEKANSDGGADADADAKTDVDVDVEDNVAGGPTFYSGRGTGAVGSDGVSLLSNSRSEMLAVVEAERRRFADWPKEGAIRFENVDMKYQTGPLVLKNLSIDVAGGEKIGICGRTGSGKSSLMVSLFRVEHLQRGHIYIDDVDIAEVPLALLRSKLGIIPQDPVMFSASVRFNLDPFKECSDEDIWRALERCQMQEHIQSLPGRLDEDVAEGGGNFSAGQRQLICIARALLRKPKILVLDEATASIDNDTDNLIQTMVRESFKSCTVLTIAHRLHTIIDSDKVLVLDSGSLAEFDAPPALLAKGVDSKNEATFASLWARHQASLGSIAGDRKSNENLAALVDIEKKKMSANDLEKLGKQ